MKDAFWHVKLSEPSSYLCTFSSPWGRKRFLRMPFGISSASEVLQKRNQETFGDIQGVHVIADDIIIATNDKDHDETVRKVMERAREKKVRFSKDKVQHRVPVVHYMGNLVSSEGLKPDKEKVKAIVEMPKPKDKKALQRLLGMVKYLAQYIPNESDITSPLRELLKEDTQWIWQPEHEKALEQIKEVLTSQPVLRFYDVEKTVQIQADASQNTCAKRHYNHHHHYHHLSHSCHCWQMATTRAMHPDFVSPSAIDCYQVPPCCFFISFSVSLLLVFLLWVSILMLSWPT